MGQIRLYRILGAWATLFFIVFAGLLFAADAPQNAVFFGQNFNSVSASPTFINDISWNSSSTATYGTVGALAAGTTTCGAHIDCIPMGDGTLAGNLEIFAGMFNHSGTLTPSATDNAGTPNTYTCTTGGTASSNAWPFLCYALNTNSGATLSKVTFGSGGTSVTNVVERNTQFYNIAQSSALDGAIGSCAGTSTTSPGCASVTTGQGNDLVWAMFCPISTPATTFTVGAGYTLEPVDQQTETNCDVEWKVDGATGSITPTATFGTSTSYIEIVAAFKADSKGTAPTGTYIAHMMSWSSDPTAGFSTIGNVTMKFINGSNDLVAETNSCNIITVSGITDSTNTWTTNSVFAGGGNNTNESYVLSATANTGTALTVNTSGTGDCTIKFYDIVNPPASLSVGRTHKNDDSATFVSGVDTWWGAGASLASGFTGVAGFPTNGISLITGGVGTNTYTSISNPSGCLFDARTMGAENISGPWSIDQNNPFGHCYFSSAPTNPLTWGLTSTSQALSAQSGDIISFFGSAGMALVNHGAAESTTATFTELTGISGWQSGDLLQVAAGVFSTGGARTVSAVCVNGNNTCSAGTALKECSVSSSVTTCASTGNTAQGATVIWEGTPTSVTQIDVVYAGGAISNGEFQFFEWRKGGTNTWADDGNGAKDSNITASGTLMTGSSITTTGTPDACAAIFTVSSGSSVPNPSGEKYILGGTAFDPTQDIAIAGGFSSTGTYAPTATGSSGQNFNDSSLCAK